MKYNQSGIEVFLGALSVKGIDSQEQPKRFS